MCLCHCGTSNMWLRNWVPKHPLSVSHRTVSISALSETTGALWWAARHALPILSESSTKLCMQGLRFCKINNFYSVIKTIPRFHFLCFFCLSACLSYIYLLVYFSLLVCHWNCMAVKNTVTASTFNATSRISAHGRQHTYPLLLHH